MKQFIYEIHVIPVFPCLLFHCLNTSYWKHNLSHVFVHFCILLHFTAFYCILMHNRNCPLVLSRCCCCWSCCCCFFCCCFCCCPCFYYRAGGSSNGGSSRSRSRSSSSSSSIWIRPCGNFLFLGEIFTFQGPFDPRLPLIYSRDGTIV